MNIYNNAPSTSRNQHGDHVAGEPMDLADTLSYVDRVPNWTEVWDPRMSTSFTTTKGLLNGPGENNCFLNSAVQVLWHLDVFRRNFRQLSGHMCMGNSCIFCALKVIFTQFQYSDRSTLPPDALRKALAWTFADQQKFQIGVMDDAAECFENILVRIHFHIVNSEPEDMCRAKHCIPHQKFAMNVVEQIVCSSCGATSEPLPFNQMVYYVSASALVRQAKFLQAQGGFPQHQFGQVLRSAVSQGDYRDCPSNCGEKVAIRRNLINLPDVVSVGLVWDSDRPITEHIHDVMTSIRTTLRLTDLFHSVVDERQAQTTILQLVGVVCYYGKHYSTFFFHSKMKKWISFDDATVREMGTEWSSVVDKCCRGHYQPLLLLYANSNDSSISMETAPRSTVMVNSDYCFNQNNGGFNSVKGNHARQRSADRDANDILPGGHKVPTSHAPLVHDSKPCRAITPIPQGSQNHCSAPNRRATTPSSELGREGKPAIVHFRQPSYLIAVDGKENGVTCTCSVTTARADTYGNTVVPPMGNEAYCNYDSVDGPCKKYTSQTSGRSENGIDLLGSLPPEGPTTNGCYLSPSVSRAVPSMQGRIQNQMAINEAIHSRVAEFVHTPSPARVSGVPLQRASNGQSGSMQQAPNKCLYTESNHFPDYRAQDMTHQRQPLRRSGSLEEVDLPPDGVGYNKAGIMAQRTRPQSARPFDYRNNVVKHPMGATNYAPGRCTNNPGERCETRTMNKMAAWMMSSTSEAGEEVYINSKTVRNILDYQKVQHQLHPATRLASQQEGRSGSPSCTTQAPSSSTTQAPLSSTAGAVTGSRSMQVEPPMTYANHNLVSRMTKTHPTNIQSHHGDSFNKTPYDSQRSSDSSGDRNSASSASSSIDSTDSYKGYYNTRQNGTSRHGSSKESSSSTQNCSNPSAAGTTKQRLVNIPESLMESRPPDSKQTSEMEKSEPTPNEKFENLCMHAEGLMDSSNRKEKGGDLPQALLHCNRAIGCIQKALAMGGVGQDSKVHAQVKCNTCVMRSRSLHRKMMTRQDSNDHTSLSVTDQDVRPPEGVTSTSKAGVVHSKQASVPSVYKRVETLYSNKTPKDAERELQHCINRLAVIDGLSQSVERNIADKTVPPGILKKPKQRAPKPKPPVRTSSIEQKKTTPSSQSQQTPQQQRRQIPVLKSQPKQQLDQPKLLPQNSRLSNQQQEQLAQFASVTSCVEAYATLPRKPGQRASRQLAESGLETDVYESYLQRQRAATSCMPGAQNTVAASSGCAMRQPATTAQYENREEGNRVRSQPRPTSASSYRCQDEATSNTNPSIMEQLIHEGLIAPHVPVSDTPKYHTPNSLHSHGIPQDNVVARDNDRQGRLTSVHPNRPEQPVQHQGRSASAVAGRRTPQPHVTQFGRPLVEGRMTPKQKQWAVTEALYYGMPTVAMTQQRSCTPTSDHSALQGEGIDGSDSSSYWGAFPPKNDLRKSSSQGYLTSSRPGTATATTSYRSRNNRQ